MRWRKEKFKRKHFLLLERFRLVETIPSQQKGTFWYFKYSSTICFLLLIFSITVFYHWWLFMILNPFMFQATRLLSTSITGALLAVVVGHFSGLFLIFISIFLFLYLYILAFLGKYIFGKFVHKSTQKERVASYLSNKFWSNWRTTVASLENWKDKFQRKNKCNVINAVPAWQQIIFPAWPEPRLLRRHILELEIWPFFLLMTQCLLEVLSPLNIGSFYFTCLTVL